MKKQYIDYVRSAEEKVKNNRLEKNSKISYQLLKETSKKRFLTVAVGAIDKIEQAWGYSWGGDEIEEEDMTPEQRKNFNLFLEIRNKIFDQCNGQIKKFETDLEDYNIQRNPPVNTIKGKTNE